MIHKSFLSKLVAVAFSLPLCVSAQDAAQAGTLSVDGVPGMAKTVTVKDRVYVDVDAIAMLLGAAQQRSPNRIVLLLRSGGETDAEKNAKLSRPFVVAGIELVSTIREWRHAIATATVRSYPFLEEIDGPLRRNADSKMAMALGAASTDADRNTMALLTTELGLMTQFSNKYLGARKASLGVNPEDVENDPLGTQIMDCAKGLAGMVATQRFQDVSSCR